MNVWKSLGQQKCYGNKKLNYKSWQKLNGNWKFLSTDESNNMTWKLNQKFMKEKESPEDVYSDVKSTSRTRGWKQTTSLVDANFEPFPIFATFDWVSEMEKRLT